MLPNFDSIEDFYYVEITKSVMAEKTCVRLVSIWFDGKLSCLKLTVKVTHSRFFIKFEFGPLFVNIFKKYAKLKSYKKYAVFIVSM